MQAVLSYRRSTCLWIELNTTPVNWDWGIQNKSFVSGRWKMRDKTESVKISGKMMVKSDKWERSALVYFQFRYFNAILPKGIIRIKVYTHEFQGIWWVTHNQIVDKIVTRTPGVDWSSETINSFYLEIQGDHITENNVETIFFHTSTDTFKDKDIKKNSQKNYKDKKKR